MEKISKLTRNTLAGKKLGRAAEAAFICHVANRVLKEIFDKDFLKEIKIISFKESILYIEIANSCYAQELKIKEGEIVGKINRSIGKNLVGKIRFKSQKSQ